MTVSADNESPFEIDLRKPSDEALLFAAPLVSLILKWKERFGQWPVVSEEEFELEGLSIRLTPLVMSSINGEPMALEVSVVETKEASTLEEDGRDVGEKEEPRPEET